MRAVVLMLGFCWGLGAATGAGDTKITFIHGSAHFGPLNFAIDSKSMPSAASDIQVDTITEMTVASGGRTKPSITSTTNASNVWSQKHSVSWTTSKWGNSVTACQTSLDYSHLTAGYLFWFLEVADTDDYSHMLGLPFKDSIMNNYASKGYIFLCYINCNLHKVYYIYLNDGKKWVELSRDGIRTAYSPAYVQVGLLVLLKCT